MAVGTVVPAAPALSAAERRIEYNIEAGDLGEALKTVSRLSGKEIIFNSEAVLGKNALRLHGTFSADEAVQALLDGTGLTAQFRKDVIIIRGRSEPSRDLTDRSTDQSEIVVTGSRIRGSEPASPITVTTRSDIEKRGITDMGGFARSLVQNFSGGQNPGIPGGGQGGSENVTSSSALNLRGLGADATLTLFNGHRVAYDAISQGVDITAVPLAAVDRVEVVADGSSALYGSDAVGGVANVILRRDYDGALASARWGAATDGGDVEQQYDLVTGRRWSTGGIMSAFDFRHSTPITAGQRSYTQTNDPTETLLNGQTQYSVVLAGHQQLADGLMFEADGQFSRRENDICVNFTATDGCLVSGSKIAVDTQMWTVAPSLRLQTIGGWEAKLAGVIGESRVDQEVDTTFTNVLVEHQSGSYINRIRSVEASAEGPLFRLPGGTARMAAGGGLRNTRFTIDVASIAGGITTPRSDFFVDRNTYYVFGEVSLPIISPSNNISLVERLSITGALRYEDVSRAGKVATPKVGIVFAPSPDIAFKFSWGKSFKAPTLYQTGRPRIGYSQIGETFYSPPSPRPGTVLYLVGGNPDLKPERATSWTATISFTPTIVEGLRIDTSYFRIKYRDRAVSPIPNNSLGFVDIYKKYVTLNPTRAQLLAALAGTSSVSDRGGGDVLSADVVAIVTNYLQNASRQSIEGFDISAEYKLLETPKDQVTLWTAASYLKSNQRLSEGQPTIQLAGTIFQQPHWRATGSVDWRHNNLSLTGTYNHIGGSLDNRIDPSVEVHSYNSFDISAKLDGQSDSGILKGASLTLTLLDIFNEKPPFVRTTSSIGYNYDANNYPSIGRFIGITISKAL
ncbi:TonB-dependent receptor [Sphingobium sp. PNB]|uniref:TonB-dependent receptor domain-containing protein n=1 Tax=Sphingobium sp. PNB TaxID=863934 RepID=UPI001CA41E73|nr:TonB-dependent receptor [Sphingobium sp. PNB]MCB4860951.1 TonB-dependent receptor [Sphingobium sp. PNB]